MTSYFAPGGGPEHKKEDYIWQTVINASIEGISQATHIAAADILVMKPVFLTFFQQKIS